MASSDGAVCVYSNNFLPPSKTFIYRQILGIPGVRIVVATKQLHHRDIFPFDPICCLQHPGGRLPTSTEHRQHWRRFLLEQDVRLIHAHFGNSALDILPVAGELDIPLVVTFWGSDVHRLALLPKYVQAYPVLFSRAARVIAISRRMLDELVGLGCPRGKMMLHYPGVSIEAFTYKERTRSASKPVRFLHASNFVPVKGVPTLIRAFKRALDGLHGAELLLAGSGKGAEECRRLVAELGLRDSVRFLGMVNPREMPDLMHSADILVHPSVTQSDGSAEGMPTVIVEAMASGLPVIATRHSANDEIVRSAQTGVLVPERDEAALAEAMIGLAGHPDQALSYARAARELVSTEFDLAKQHAVLSELYRSVARRAPAQVRRRPKVLITAPGASAAVNAPMLCSVIVGLYARRECEIRVVANGFERTGVLYPRVRVVPAPIERRSGDLFVPTVPDLLRKALKKTSAWLARRGTAPSGRLPPEWKRVCGALAWSDVIVHVPDGVPQKEFILRGVLPEKPFVVCVRSSACAPDHRFVSDTKRILRAATLILARDRAALAFARSLGLPEQRLSAIPQPAFALPIARGSATRPMRAGRRPRVAVVVHDACSEWASPQAAGADSPSRSALLELLRHLALKRGAVITLVPSAPCAEGRPDDSAAHEIATSLEPEARAAVSVETRPLESAALLRLIGEHDACVGNWTDALILACLAGTPVAGIGGEPAVSELFEALGLDEHLIDGENMAADKVATMAGRLLDSGDDIRAAIESRLPELISQAGLAARKIDEIVGAVVRDMEAAHAAGAAAPRQRGVQ